MTKYLTLNQWLIFLMLSCTTLIGGILYLGFVAITYRQDRADPVHGPQIRAYEAAKDTSAIAARAQNLFALKACGVVVAIFMAAGLVASVMAKPDVTDRVARTAEARSLRPVVSDGCDLAGAIPDCKKVMAKLAAGHSTRNDNGSEAP